MSEEYNNAIRNQFEDTFMAAAKKGVDKKYVKSLEKKDIDGLFDEGKKILNQIEKAYKVGMSQEVITSLEGKQGMVAAFALLQSHTGYYGGYDMHYTKEEVMGWSVSGAMRKANSEGLLVSKQTKRPLDIQKTRV